RLIDWAGEFNSYLVPFAPFGLGTVSRTLQPQLAQFLYQLSASDGADPTRAQDTGADPTRNGEPEGELGVVLQHDAAWQDQTGGPIDPQAGNIPGGTRDVLRSANFNNATTLQAAGFAVDSGVWTVSNGQLQVAAASLGQEATTVFNLDEYLPIYYEIAASMSTQKPTSGWNANSFVLFDYFSKTDFKFAGLDFSTNKIVIGHRTATAWVYDFQTPFTSSLKPATSYQTLVAVNGTVVTVSVNNAQSGSFTYAARIVDGQSAGLNKGFVGFGSNNSRGTLDNLAVRALPVANTLRTADVFGNGVPAQLGAGMQSGTWSATSGGLYGNTSVGQTAISTAALDRPIASTSQVQLDAALSTTAIGGLVFDAYAVNDYKFAALDVDNQRVVIGHVDPRRGWVVQAAFPTSLAVGASYALTVLLKETVASVSLNGNVLGSFEYNASPEDGKAGMLTSGGSTNFASFVLRTNDPGYANVPKVSDAQQAEGNSGLTPVTVTLTLPNAVAAATSVGWTTVAGTAKAGVDYQSASGTATFAAGSATASLTVYLIGNTTYQPDRIFGVQLTNWPGLVLAKPMGIVTIVNDDPVPLSKLSMSAGDVSTVEGDRKTTTVNVPVTLSAAATSTVTVVATTVAGSALAGGDFISTSATLTFAAGTTVAYVAVQIVGDTVAEPTETFSVVLSSPSGGVTIAKSTGVVTIIDNDGAMFAAAPAPAGAAAERPLTESALAPVLTRAEGAWSTVLPQADFSGVRVTISDLPGDLLGFTLGQSIRIDPTAAGWGWSVMYPGSPVPRIDLLSVVMHELGLALGFHEADAAEPFVMARTLAPSVGPQAPPRLLPLAPAAAAKPATIAAPILHASVLPLLRPAAPGLVGLAAPGWIGSGATLRWVAVHPALHKIFLAIPGPLRAR
ncbi:MAG: Calx-beta domain-containing protein, partial [Gaiellaceae bacterium]